MAAQGPPLHCISFEIEITNTTRIIFTYSILLLMIVWLASCCITNVIEAYKCMLSCSSVLCYAVTAAIAGGKGAIRMYKGIQELKEQIAKADAIMIGAGAGLSTAAGFVYSGKRFEKNLKCSLLYHANVI